MRRQFRLQELAQFGPGWACFRISRQSRPRASSRPDRPCEPSRRLVHPRMLGQSSLDFTELNAESMNFNLIIAAPKIFEFAVLQESRQIAGFVHARRGLAFEWIWNKSLRGQVGPAQITACTPPPPTYSSPTTPAGTGLLFGIEQIEAKIGNRNANQAARFPLQSAAVIGR